MRDVNFQTDVAEKLKPFIEAIDDLKRLDHLHRVATRVSNIDEFTQALLNLEIRNKREALAGWIADFGIGSAVFDSGLLQDLMEEPVC